MGSKYSESEGFMDEVNVKISKKYKPPPRISLVMSYAQSLTLYKQTAETIPDYKFVLEKTVIDKMKEWKNIRALILQQLDERVETSRLNIKEASDQVPHKESETAYCNSEHYPETQLMLMPTQANILTPTPLQNKEHGYNTSPFNFSDFEEDTSSPFDNMELKSINDMEELAQVLKSDKSLITNEFSTPRDSYKHISNESAYSQKTSGIYDFSNGCSENRMNTTYFGSNSNYSNQSSAISTTEDSLRSNSEGVVDIIRTLESELDNTHLDSSLCNKSQVFTNMKSDESLDVFGSLPKSVQDLSKSISLMGFPLSRVARVCKIVGCDQKKVVDHLLAMSDLLDLGFSEVNVSKALIQSNNDRDKALDILIS